MGGNGYKWTHVQDLNDSSFLDYICLHVYIPSSSHQSMNCNPDSLHVCYKESQEVTSGQEPSSRPLVQSYRPLSFTRSLTVNVSQGFVSVLLSHVLHGWCKAVGMHLTSSVSCLGQSDWLIHTRFDSLKPRYNCLPLYWQCLTGATSKRMQSFILLYKNNKPLPGFSIESLR